ncbi:MAG: type I-B CRISPR-associated protein Cas5b [Bacillota bacterium]
MRVLKVELEGLTTSFRYPHFMWGRQPTFPMPPPATIYGHICSAVGDWVDPRGVEFGYVFTHDGQATDLECCHTLSVASSRAAFEWKGERISANLQGVVNPLKRDFLFRPRLTLYLNRPDWLEYFHAPRYPVVLGRSQDLATYTRVTIIELKQCDDVYYEHTLLPFKWRTCTGRGVTITMPRFVNYHNNREPQFDRYIALQERSATADWVRYECEPLSHWVDSETPEWRGCQRGVVFHRFLE